MSFVRHCHIYTQCLELWPPPGEPEEASLKAKAEDPGDVRAEMWKEPELLMRLWK